jgi:signal transduction histidine kinase
MTSDDLILGAIVAHEVVARMDQFSLLQRLQDTAATEARIRLARDLHDGLLQSLTGAALQLETVHRLLDKDPQVARERVLDIQRLLAAEQHDLRSFIWELKLTPLSPAETDACLATRLQELGERIERHWGLRVAIHVQCLEAEIPETLARDIYRLVHEALINAARHAHAAAARVELDVTDMQVRITVADDGCGFPFRGHYDLAALTTLNLGPVTLKERIVSLDGSLVIDSTEAGARLHMTLPLAWPACLASRQRA